MSDELEWLNSLSRANAEDKKRIKELYESIFGDSKDICFTCPSSIRLAVNKLKNYARH